MARREQLLQRFVEPARAGHGMPPALDEIPQQVARTWQAQRNERGAIEAVVADGRRGIQARQVIEQFSSIGLQRGSTCKRGSHRWKMRVQQGQHLLAECVAAKTNVQIAVVLHPIEAMCPRIGQQFDASHAQERPQLTGVPAGSALRFGHGRQPFGARATQQLQQQGFGLVVLVMRGEQPVAIERGKNMLALAPCGGFDSGRVIARDLHTMYRQFNGMACAKLRAEFRPGVGVGREAVVDMYGMKLKRKRVAQRQQQMQQHDRIESARQRQGQARLRLDVAAEAV